MHFVIRFVTDKFDVHTEDENPNNQIYGQSLLQWLREKVGKDLAMTKPDHEDWGWYSYINWDGRPYMVGANSEDDPSEKGTISEHDGIREWVFQLEKQRSLKEKLLGREKMTPDDPCFNYFIDLFSSEPSCADIEVE